MSLRDLLPGSVGSGSGASGADRLCLRSRFFRTVLQAERELWVLAIGAMFVDVMLTVHGLDIGLVEINPVARRALADAGTLGLYALKSLALLVGGFGRVLMPNHLNGLVPLFLAVPSLIAVGINSTLIASLYL